MLRHRLLTSLIGVPLIICIVYVGGYYFFISLLAIILIGTYEFFNIMRNKRIEYSLYGSFILNALIPIFIFIGKQKFILFLIIIFIFFSSFWKALIKVDIDKLIEKVSLEIFSAFYVSLFLSYFLLIRRLSNGAKLVILLLGIVWLNDSFAYFVGKRWGRVRINKHVSPNKTVEGAIGGFLGGTITALIFGYFFHFNLLLVFLLAIIVITFSQIGDLIESAFKREGGLKDAGTILPGHGGVLDRFDGLIYGAPVFYYLITFIFKSLGG